MIEDRESRDTALGFCLEGEEKRRHCQAVAERHLFDFISSFRYACGGVLACEAVEAVLAVLFPDGNYQYYHNTLQYNSVNKAFALVNSGRYDGAVAALKSARYHAGEMAKYGRAAEFRFTGPFFDLVSGEKPVSDAVEDDVDDFRRCLDNNRCFDVIREREEFQELYK